MNDEPRYDRLRLFLTRRRASFRYAFAGLAHVFRTQPNAWIHGAAAAGVVLAGFWLDLSHSEWGLVVVTMALVVTTEILNTAIEAVVDLASPEPHPLARTAKDCAAAAVLVTAGMAVVVGALVFAPKLWDRLG